MLTEIYQPFDRFNFGNKTCFLSGKPLQSEEEKIQVFPAWLLARYNLYDAPFKMLDENFPTYKDLKLPCSAEINNQYLEPLETEIKAAFEQGFEAVQALGRMETVYLGRQNNVRHYFQRAAIRYPPAICAGRRFKYFAIAHAQIQFVAHNAADAVFTDHF